MQHQKITAALVAVCLSSGTLAAQIVPQNRHDTIVLSVYNANQRFMLYQAPFGKQVVTTSVLADMVAAYDTAFVWREGTTPDSTGALPIRQVVEHQCNKLTGNVLNKIAIITMNPNCDASLTYFNAQKAGAKAAILIHTTNSKDSVWLSPQSRYAFADSIKIPCYTVRREMGEKMSGLLPSLVGIAKPDSIPSDIQALKTRPNNGTTVSNDVKVTTLEVIENHENTEGVTHVGIGLLDVGNVPKSDVRNLKSAFGLSPNPANDVATLTFNLSKKTDLTLEILNEAGQLMLRKSLQGTQLGSLDFDTRDWGSGAHFIHLTDGKGVKEVKRLVVQH
jgi:hypothetical protein